MIPMHPNHVNGRYTNAMYANRQQQYQFQMQHHPHNHHHPQQQPHHLQQHQVMWTLAPASVMAPSSLPPLRGRYVPPPSTYLATMANQQHPSHHRTTSSVPPTNFVAISPAMPPRSLTGQLPDRSIAPSLTTTPQTGPTVKTMTSPVPSTGTVGGKVKHKDEYEAAEVLLGLTSKDEKVQEGSNSQPPPKKRKIDSMANATSATNKTLPLGHVTDESSVGTTSPTPPMVCTEDPSKWYSGSISLSLPEDDDVLSPLHCFMRKYCVEAFSASSQDVATPRYGKSHGFKVEEGQVGIRCIYCKNLPVGKRPERAVCYPSSLRNIYHSIETWQRRHSLVCTHISPWVRKSIEELMESSKTRAGGRRQYWEDSAKRLGMVDTARGVRFIRPPGDLGPVHQPTPVGGIDANVKPKNSRPIVEKEDMDLVTDYLYLLMDQMQTCYFTEEDRTGGRSKIKDISLNFPGYECRHCHGRAGFGRYFPTSVAALSLANSDRNVFNHLKKCRRCPTQIKEELIRLSKDQGQSKNRRGLRKLFFGRIWERMHGTSQELSSNTSSTASSPAVLATKA